MPKTPAQNAEIREATRQKILLSSMRVFARQGYATTTIKRISAEAGVSVGLIYHYFDSKEALLEAVVDRALVSLGGSFEMVMTAEVADSAERLAILLNHMFTLLVGEQEYWQLFYMLRGQPAVADLMREKLCFWTDQLRLVFVQLLTDMGRAEPEMDALILYSLVEGTIQQYQLNPDTYPLSAVVERIISQFAS